MPVPKITLFLALSSILIFSGCSVVKKVNKSQTSTEQASKVDSTSHVKNDVTKESKIESVVTEVIDTTVFLTPAGELITDTARVVPASIPVKVKKKKVTKTTAQIQEVDKSKTRVEVKKKEKKEETKKEVVKDITKTGISFWWWLIIIIAALVALAWKFRKVFVR